MIMLMAGYETTATTMSILAYCIAMEPEVQEKLYQEIVETIEKSVSCWMIEWKVPDMLPHVILA